MVARETITIGFAGLKGGCGKSTIAISFTGFLSYIKEMAVVAVDADDHQKSFYYQRERDIVSLGDENQVKLHKRFSKQNKEIYPVENSNSMDAPTLIRSLRESGQWDVIVVDTGGKIDPTSSLPLLREMDYIIIPFEAEAKSLDANSKYLTLLAQTVIRQKDSRVKEAYIFWNKMRPNEKKEIFISAYTALAQAGYKMFNSLVEYKKSYQEEENTQSTLLPLQGASASSNMAALIKEIIGTLNLKAASRTKKKDPATNQPNKITDPSPAAVNN